MYILELYKSKNIIEHCGTIDYYVDEKVGQLYFSSKTVATSIRVQLLRQNLFDKIELVEDKSE
jgi:hypothetical protein